MRIFGQFYLPWVSSWLAGSAWMVQYRQYFLRKIKLEFVCQIRIVKIITALITLQITHGAQRVLTQFYIMMKLIIFIAAPIFFYFLALLFFIEVIKKLESIAGSPRRDLKHVCVALVSWVREDLILLNLTSLVIKDIQLLWLYLNVLRW